MASYELFHFWIETSGSSSFKICNPLRVNMLRRSSQHVLGEFLFENRVCTWGNHKSIQRRNRFQYLRAKASMDDFCELACCLLREPEIKTGLDQFQFHQRKPVFGSPYQVNPRVKRNFIKN